MSQLIKDVTNQLRQKNNYWLINYDSFFYDNNFNPFGYGKVPLMCEFNNDHVPPSLEAYESGNRSIFFQYKDFWVKAKGIGIPIGWTRPIYDDKKIYTYQLVDDPGMCHKSIIWGFQTQEEFECELYGAAKAEELGQKVRLLGYTSFKDVSCLKMKDRAELLHSLHLLRSLLES